MRPNELVDRSRRDLPLGMSIEKHALPRIARSEELTGSRDARPTNRSSGATCRYSAARALSASPEAAIAFRTDSKLRPRSVSS